MALTLDTMLTVDFRPEGNHHLYPGHGWAEPGWTEGKRSGITLGVVASRHEYFLCIDAVPYIDQTFTVYVNGRSVGSHYDVRPLKIAFPVTRETMAQRSELGVAIELHHPRRPCDNGPSADEHWRGLQVKTISVVGSDECLAQRWSLRTAPTTQAPDDAALLSQFESLGDNCEFGFVQKRAGVVGSSLLRFCATPIFQLLRGLDNGFEGLADGDGITLATDGPPGADDYQVWIGGYGLHYHTLVRPDERDAGSVLAAEQEKIRHKLSKLLADLRGCERIFVVKQNYELQPGEVWALWLALQRYGANTLLWVRADPSCRKPTVDVMRPGLLRGTIGRFAGYACATESDDLAWHELCREARRLRSNFC